jgi:tetratricopeptide (TPR) repeat protein
MKKLALSAAALLAAATALPAAADELRHIKPGQPIPDFALPTLDGDRLGRAELEGKTVILVYLSAQQRRSELAAAGALAVWRTLRRDDIALVFATADTDQPAAFRRHRAAANLSQPLLLDADRQLYGDLGLIVGPTTIVIDSQWRLAHVISSYRADYEHVLEAYVDHAQGRLNDEQLASQLEASTFQRDSTEQRIARHRAAAEVLRTSGLTAEAQRELQSALAIEPAHTGAQLDLAALLIRLDRPQDATALVAAVLRANPGQPRARLLNGIVLYHTGHLNESEAVLSEALIVNPDPVQTHYYLGLIWERKGDQARANEHFKKALSRLLEDHPL